MIVVVNDLANVTVDGVAAGTVPDVLTNYGTVEGIRGAVQAALEAWYAIRKQANAASLQAAADAHAAELERAATEHQAALTAALADQAAQHEAAAAAMQQRCDSQVSQLNAQIAELTAQLAKTQAGATE